MYVNARKVHLDVRDSPVSKPEEGREKGSWMTESQQRYRVVEKLEAGGMAEVYRAESEGLQGFRKQVAIKRVLPHLSEKKKFISMFLDEARLSAQLSHSNCVQVFDIGVGDSAYFIVVEYVDGGNLKSIAESLKKQGKIFPVQIAVFIAIEICKGLAYAHEARDSSGSPLHIVHRDMSPPNVLVTKYGEIKIVDFGLAKASSQLEKSEPGIIKGKFSYLSPEAAMGQEVDARTDIFAVGIILWELLSGQRLFLGDTDFQTVKKVQQAVVPPISQVNRDAPPELEKILNKALTRDPAVRYMTARELGQDLSRFLFHFGQPVSTFDVAALVLGTMRERQKFRAPQGSIIDKLIEEALFEFTSLKEDEKAEAEAALQSSLGARPLDHQTFVDPTNWASEIGSGLATLQQTERRAGEATLRASMPAAPEDGNLSSLEDLSPSPPSLPGAFGASPLPAHLGGNAASVALARHAQPALGAQNRRASDKANTSTLVVILALLTLVAAALIAAWFLKLIPH
jgi:eukaryotic-like serine/threonine-protein kinase